MIDIPKEDLCLLRFLTVPFKVYGVCEDLEDNEQPQFVVKVFQDESQA